MILKSINNKKGNGLILSCVLVLVFMMIFVVISEHARTYMTTRSARDGLESIATTIATNNYDEIYQAQREGYFSANILNSKDNWEEDIDNSNMDEYLNEVLGLNKENNIYVKKDKNQKIDFQLSNIKVNINNPSLAPQETEKNKEKFTVEITGDLEINKMFSLFTDNENIKVKVGAKVGYIPKF